MPVAILTAETAPLAMGGGEEGGVLERKLVMLG